MRIPRSLRDLQAWRESRLFDFSFQRLFHGLDLLLRQRRQELSFCAVVSDAMSCDHESQGGVLMLMDNHFASGHGGAPLGSLDLQDKVVKAHGVVPINCTLESLRKTISRFLFRQDRNAVPRCAAGTVKRRLNSAM